MSNPLSHEETIRIREMLASGQSHNSIAKQLGRAQSTISGLAKREGFSPLPARVPTVANQARRDFALEERLEATGELMAKVLEIAAHAESGREIKECSVAWGVLCDKRAIMEGRPSSRTETYSGRPHPGKTINLEEEFAKLDREMIEEQQRQALSEE